MFEELKKKIAVLYEMSVFFLIWNQGDLEHLAPPDSSEVREPQRALERPLYSKTQFLTIPKEHYYSHCDNQTNYTLYLFKMALPETWV